MDPDVMALVWGFLIGTPILAWIALATLARRQRRMPQDGRLQPHLARRRRLPRGAG